MAGARTSTALTSGFTRGCRTKVRLPHAKAQASRRAAFPGRSPPANADGPVAVRAVVQPGGSAGAKLVVERDNAAGGVVRDVREHRLALGGSTRCTQRGRVVEVGLEHAEIR